MKFLSPSWSCLHNHPISSSFTRQRSSEILASSILSWSFRQPKCLLYKMLLLCTKMALIWTTGGCTSLLTSLNHSVTSSKSNAMLCRRRQANDGQQRLFRFLCSLIHANFQPSFLLVWLFFFSVSTDRPITFLFNTLNYYEHCLRDKPSLKKKLVGAIIGEFTRLYLISFWCSRLPPLCWFLKGKLCNPQ